jgi:hypothetical protein
VIKEGIVAVEFESFRRGRGHEYVIK